jgi:hypothetical protein
VFRAEGTLRKATADGSITEGIDLISGGTKIAYSARTSNSDTLWISLGRGLVADLGQSRVAVMDIDRETAAHLPCDLPCRGQARPSISLMVCARSWRRPMTWSALVVVVSGLFGVGLADL